MVLVAFPFVSITCVFLPQGFENFICNSNAVEKYSGSIWLIFQV
jgi:hypothetical protein